MKEVLRAILSDDPAAVVGLPIPRTYRGVVVRKEDETIFAGLASRDKDPRASLHLDEVPTPELGPGEAIVAVMASSINFNTVWTSIFEPVSTFGFLKSYGRLNELSKRHDLPYHVVGSDLAGVVLAVGVPRAAARFSLLGRRVAEWSEAGAVEFSFDVEAVAAVEVVI